MRALRRGAVAGALHAPWWSYRGLYSERTIDVGGVPRTLLTLRGSGDLTVLGDLWGDVWLCGCGGTGGDSIPGVKAGDGGGGGHWVEYANIKLATCPVTIPYSSAGPTLFMGQRVESAAGKAGGSGGGAGAMVGSVVPGGAGSGGTGVVPFGLTGVFKPHCAGGGGGGFHGGGTGLHGEGGVGGSAGTVGGDSTTGGDSYLGGAGGSYGGGMGGDGFTGEPTYLAHGVAGRTGQYGSGGGGGGGGLDAAGVGFGGAGVQGIVYILLAQGE